MKRTHLHILSCLERTIERWRRAGNKGRSSFQEVRPVSSYVGAGFKTGVFFVEEKLGGGGARTVEPLVGGVTNVMAYYPHPPPFSPPGFDHQHDAG